MATHVYETLNKAWKFTCKIIFGEEIGELGEYESWLKEYMMPIGNRKSYISGKEVVFAKDEFCKDARFVSSQEAKEKSIEPLTINEIKDIDSIIEVISEKWEYAGNKLLGNSYNVESSDMVSNSQYVCCSNGISDSSYVYAFSQVHANSKNLFGGCRAERCNFSIGVIRASEVSRCFETHLSSWSSDLYFCSYIKNCTNLMFSFNQANKSCMIGNLQLPKEKYFSIKSKLLAEIREELKRNRRLPSIFEIVPNEEPEVGISMPPRRLEEDMEAIESAFSSTFKIILRKDIRGIEKYEKWLSRHFGTVKELESLFGSKTYIVPKEDYPIYRFFPEKRAVTENEAIKLGELHLNMDEIASLEKIKKRLSKISYLTDEYIGGASKNLIKTSAGHDAVNLYKTGGAACSKFIGIASNIVDSENLFGCDDLSAAKFSIKCYNSNYITRCFEVDFCRDCSDSYFCHNCEGLSEAMFCWNTKSKRYAIGNAQIEPEKYRKIKSMLLEQMADEIIKKRELKWDIFNIGCGKSYA